MAVLKTGLTPSASGSAYLELERPSDQNASNPSLLPSTSSLKLTCTVHGPKPLPRSAPFTPNIILSTHIKFAPFATRQRRGYIRDVSERDLAVHLETALRGVIIGDRWPKSGVEVVITVLEGDEDHWWGDDGRNGPVELNAITGCGMMNILAGCITVASAAIIDAGIDCVDVISGGVAAVVPNGSQNDKAGSKGNPEALNGLLLDPLPSEHECISAACVVGYLPSRQEITELWIKGDVSDVGPGRAKDGAPPKSLLDELVDGAIGAALGTSSVLGEAVKEAAGLKTARLADKKKAAAGSNATKEPVDIEMNG